jgi:16S rRNA (cytidine1402-2'-O)-methyltransferase
LLEDVVSKAVVGFLKPYTIYTTAVGFLPKHAGSRRERLMVSANEMTTQIFYVPPHKLNQFLEETFLHFGGSR